MSGVPTQNIIGGGSAANRKTADFYATPLECTLALMSVEALAIREYAPVWEPACGDGAICQVLERYGINTTASDMYSRGCGQSGIDFLKTSCRESLAVVTNPPFSLAAKFIQHAWSLKIEYMALLLKSTFWHARIRWPLFKKRPPSVIYPLLWRPDFSGGGSPTMDCFWVVWDFNRQNGTQYQPLLRVPCVRPR